MLKFLLYAGLILCNTVFGSKITSYTWENTNIEYYIVKNKYTPHFNTPVSIVDLVDRVVTEYQLPGITLNLTFMGELHTRKRQKFDGKNTISFSPSNSAGGTQFYSQNILQRKEFDMKFNSRIFKTVETLYNMILHEFGHVFGLSNTHQSVDSIMSSGIIMKNDGSYVQDNKYYTLTKPDVIGLFKHEAIFRSTTPYQRQYLNHILISILSSYPTTIGLQKCDILKSFSKNIFREGGTEDEEEVIPDSIEDYYSEVSLI